jgi:hypothetical protein
VALRQRLAEVTHERDLARSAATVRSDLVPLRSSALVVWRPRR